MGKILDDSSSPCVVYSPRYNIGFYGLERLHPFDTRKYGRVWKRLKRHFGSDLRHLHVEPMRAASREELLRVHPPELLARLQDSKFLASALEVPSVRHLPWWAIDRHVLRPMRWATRGTIVAAQNALKCGFAINLSGGYHHAKPDQCEGFSIYADAAIAVASLRSDGLISEAARVIMIDTDAHQGNGVCYAFMDDPRVFIFDVFNCKIYPSFDKKSRNRIDCPVEVTAACSDSEYLELLSSKLPGFLDSVCNSSVGLAIHNAGTDVYLHDPLGGLGLSANTILQRDLFVAQELRKRSIPSVMLLSGGYTRESHRLVADSVIKLLGNEATWLSS